MTITAMHCRMARAALEWGVRDLARAAQVGTTTIVRFEGGKDVNPPTKAAIKRAMEEMGIVFTRYGVSYRPGGEPMGSAE